MKSEEEWGGVYFEYWYCQLFIEKDTESERIDQLEENFSLFRFLSPYRGELTAFWFFLSTKDTSSILLNPPQKYFTK